MNSSELHSNATPTSSTAVTLQINVPQAAVQALADALVVAMNVAASAQIESAGPLPAWMSVETAAQYLDVSPERLRKLVNRRQIPFHQEARGCRVLFGREDLDTWMASIRHAPRDQGHGS